MLETGAEQGQWAAQQVVTDDFQRDQAELGIEGRQGRAVAVIAGAKPDALAIVDQAQLEDCSQQCRKAQRQAQGVTQSGTGEQGVTQHAIARHMHALAQFQADVFTPGNGIGADLQLLLGGDACVGMPQVRRADAAAGQQGRRLATLCLEDVEDQRNRVEGGEVAMQHARYPVGWDALWSKLCAASLWQRSSARPCRQKKGPKHAPGPLKG
ncbi:hypothetical protein D3C81_1543550 [compost metagenome]